jgi:hypothetical protein
MVALNVNVWGINSTVVVVVVVVVCAGYMFFLHRFCGGNRVYNGTAGALLIMLTLMRV